MNDPHVVALRYRLVLRDEHLTIENPPPVEWQVPVCAFRLEDGILTATTTGHYATVDEAKNAIEPHVKAYCLHSMLTFGQTALDFKYERADVIDRCPPALRPGDHNIVVGTVNLVLVGATLSAVGHVIRRQYPPPPPSLTVSPDVETLWNRYDGWKAGREPLPAMAYFCLTVVESLGGKARGRRERAGAMLNVDPEVLNKLGELTSDVADPKTGRKWHASQRRAHTGAEQTWMDEAVRLVIRRMAEIAAGAAGRHHLSMADLPPLP